MILRIISSIIILCLFTSCSENGFDVEEYNSNVAFGLNKISNIIGIEKYGKFYYIADGGGDTVKIPSTEFEKGVLYVKDVFKKENYCSIKLSNGEVSNFPCFADTEIKYRVPNISSLRLDGYDIQIKVVIKDINSLLRINHGEPNIGGLVCSSFIDFANSRIGYYKPYTIDGEKTTEVLIEREQIIPFIKGHVYTIVSSKHNGCVASLSIKDNETGESYEFSPEIKCYESGITHGWGKSSYEEMGGIEVLDFKIYSNQDFNSRLLILGDSNADHGGLGSYKWRNYTRQIKLGMNGSAFLVVQGGAGTSNFISWLDEYAMDLCKPKYCLVTTYNETNFSRWYSNIQEILNRLKRENITPILATIHPAEGDVIGDTHSEINDWIRSSGFLVFDVAKVISLNHDGVTTWKDILTPPNWVHFNLEANNILAKNFFETFPYLSNN